MNIIGLALNVISKIPFEKMLIKRTSEVQSIDNLLTNLKSTGLSTKVVEEEILPAARVEPKKTVSSVTTRETVDYQNNELAKELLLLERHLVQGCSIAGKPCDCCEKHPIAIEALALETLGITGNNIYSEIAKWSKKIMPLTTVEAASSGEHADIYPRIATEARNYRKKIGFSIPKTKETAGVAKETEQTV